MKQRKITLQDVYNCVKLGSYETAKNDLIRCTYKNHYVILNDDNNTVITVCYVASYNNYIKKVAKKVGISYHQAIKLLAGGEQVAV